MAYDFGSQTLGIKNPFKIEGFIRFLAGLLITLLGVYALFQVTALIDTQLSSAWLYAIAGFVLLVLGLKRCGSGLMQLFKFFVGRSVPASLAYNLTKSERDNAKLEEQSGSLAYPSSALESMLMGRKNLTFVEPQGWLARLAHTVFPRLIFLPYPIRNLVQDIFALAVTTFIAFVAFGLTYFVAAVGLAGAAGPLIITLFSFILVLYLVFSWRRSAQHIRLSKVKTLNSASATSLAKIIALSIVFPVVIGLAYNWLATNEPRLIADTEALFAQVASFSAWPLLSFLIVLMLISMVLIAVLVKQRGALIQTNTEVAEYRENLQESVHPNEIFINIENIVLANRRYKEVPNRTYIEFSPRLNEQSQGKGDFAGELLIETQPALAKTEVTQTFSVTRLLTTLFAQVLVVAGAATLLLLTSQLTDLWQMVSNNDVAAMLKGAYAAEFMGQLSAVAMPVLATLLLCLLLYAGGHILENAAHIFWAELQFTSLLMYMKTEGTFTESKISTGMSIHDSTRSENVIVKSSITPWIVSSRINTSTFADSGQNNVEMPRYVMSLHKNEEELSMMVDEIRSFLKNRETIAGFSNSQDLRNAENILRVNQVSRQEGEGQRLTETEQASGYLRHEQDDEEPKA